MGDLCEPLGTLSLCPPHVSPAQADGWDTDPEEAAEAGGDGRCCDVYRRLCQEVGIVPVSYFIRHINDTHMNLNHHGLGPRGAYAIAMSLISNTSITHLSLEENWILPEGLTHLLHMLRENQCIQELNLSDNGLGVRGSLEISKMLLENISLRNIKLAHNGFKDESAGHFAEALAANSQVTELDLSHNEFCEAGGAHLGQMLAANEGLRVLDLSWNHIRMRGAIAFSAGLRVSDSLRVLNLSHNGFGNDGALALGEALKANGSLRHLDITCNRIGNEGSRLLCKGLEANESLRVLKISRNPLTVEGAVFLLTSITKRPENKMEELDMSSVLVNPQFLSLLDAASLCRPALRVLYAGKQGFTKKQPARRPDPMKVIQNYLDEHKLRLLDFYKNMDKDGSLRIPVGDFCRHISMAGIPLDGEQMEILLQTLDKEQTGSVDYRDLVDSRKKMVRKQREKLRQKEIQERQERQRSERALRSFHTAVRALSPPLPSKVAPGGSASSCRVSAALLSSWCQEGETKAILSQSDLVEGSLETECYYSSQTSLGSQCLSEPPSPPHSGKGQGP